MNNITKEEKAKVFAMYLDVEVIAPHPQEEGETLKGYLTGINGEMEAEVQHHDGLHAWEHPEYHDFDNTKLLLTPLSEITDEDAIEVAKMMIQHGKVYFSQLAEPEVVENTDEKIVVRIPGLYLHVYFDGKLLSTGRQDGKNIFTAIYNTGQIHQFLISRGYSVPLFFGIDHWANGMDAIQLGIGIAKTKEG